MRLLALPGVFLVVSFLGSASSGGFSFFAYLGMFIVAYTSLYVSMSSIGSEGKSILNLYEAPLVTRDFVIGKSLPPIIFGSCFGIAFYAVSELIVSRTLSPILPLFLSCPSGWRLKCR